MLHAVDYLACQNVVHRDIKPENFIITPKQHVQLIDFNVSRRWNPQTEKLMTETGTKMFNAPEILNSPSYDGKVDIWSIGASLYTLISGGLPPFYEENVARLKKMILEEEPPYDSIEFKNFEPLGLDLLKKMLTKDPKMRPSAKECLNHTWFSPLNIKSLNIYD
eukprot:CAMPEP_0170487024 /NCGR_PEP_ID=MMETSP0208-20121228/5892_1 /TAXON_ID=197538 /ORGANISM="Strombidium inclinatum, Strain S3" /LENGTH=163 /DNA_ID=CAMNT_0010761133 /DNA_START=1940 /DNA_END=2431 /DNA_ORIENTATION=+